jgi:uncharacterized protein
MSAESPQPAREGITELALAEWRREVFDMYREVRLDRDPERAHARWRERRDRLFREHSLSPLAVDDPLRETGIPYWPYDPRLRFSLPVLKAARPARYSLPTEGEEVTELRQVGWVELPEALGPRLAVWWLAQYGGGLFVPFRDQTAGRESYGAGRYLLDTVKGADLGLDGGRLVLDFNFSYHPSCRYDDGYRCPLAPPESVLAGAVRAGERL